MNIYELIGKSIIVVVVMLATFLYVFYGWAIIVIDCFDEEKVELIIYRLSLIIFSTWFVLSFLVKFLGELE